MIYDLMTGGASIEVRLHCGRQPIAQFSFELTCEYGYLARRVQKPEEAVKRLHDAVISLRDRDGHRLPFDDARHVEQQACDNARIKPQLDAQIGQVREAPVCTISHRQTVRCWVLIDRVDHGLNNPFGVR